MTKFHQFVSAILLSFISSSAFAQGAPASTGSTLMSFVPLIFIFGIFYFLLIRPQQKRFKEHQEMVNSLKIGNKVVTSSGIIGKIKEIDDKEKTVSLEIAPNVVVDILKNSVSELVQSESTKDKKKN